MQFSTTNNSGCTLTNNNTTAQTNTTTFRRAVTSTSVSSGKLSFELDIDIIAEGIFLGITSDENPDSSNVFIGSSNNSYGIYGTPAHGYVTEYAPSATSPVNSGTQLRASDTVAFTFDADNGYLYYSVNGGTVYEITGIPSGTYYVVIGSGSASKKVTTTISAGLDISPDTEIPVITLVGNANITITEGSTYTEQGATWTDNADGSGDAVVTGSVDTSTAGTYFVTYNYTDAAGNAANEVTRTVVVNALDNIALTNTYGYNGYSQNDFNAADLLASSEYTNDIGESISFDMHTDNGKTVPIAVNHSSNANNGDYTISAPLQINKGNLSEYKSYLGWDASMMQYLSKRKRRSTYLIKVAIDGFTVRDYIEKNSKLIDLIETEIKPKVDALFSQNVQGRVRALLFHAGMDDEPENIIQEAITETIIPVEEREFSDEPLPEPDVNKFTELLDCTDSTCTVKQEGKSFAIIHSFQNTLPWIKLKPNQEPGDLVVVADNPAHTHTLYDFSSLPNYQYADRSLYESTYFKEELRSKFYKALQRNDTIIEEVNINNDGTNQIDINATYDSRIKLKLPSNYEGISVQFSSTDPNINITPYNFSGASNGTITFDSNGEIILSFTEDTPKTIWYYISSEPTTTSGTIKNHFPAYLPEYAAENWRTGLYYNIVKNLVSKSTNNPEGSKKILLISDATMSEDYQWWGGASYTEEFYLEMCKLAGIELHNVPHTRINAYDATAKYSKEYDMQYWQNASSEYAWILHFTNHIDDLEWKNKIRSTDSYLEILEYLEQYDGIIYNCIAKHNTWGSSPIYNALQAFRERGGGLFMQASWRYYVGTMNPFLSRYGIKLVNGGKSLVTRYNQSYQDIRASIITEHQKYFEDDGSDLILKLQNSTVGAYFTFNHTAIEVSPTFEGTLNTLNAVRYDFEVDAKAIRNLFDRTRKLFGNIPVFYGAVESEKSHSAEVFQALTNLKQIGKTIQIDTSDLIAYDDRHYSPDSMVELGIRYGKALVPVLQGEIDLAEYNPSLWVNPASESFPKSGNLLSLPNLSETFDGFANSVKSPATCGYDINGDHAIYISRDSLYLFDKSPLTSEGSCSEFSMFYILRPTYADQRGYLWWQVDSQQNRFLSHAPWDGKHYFDFGNIGEGERIYFDASIEPQLLSYRFSVTDNLGMMAQIATQSGEDTIRVEKVITDLSPVPDSTAKFGIGGQALDQGQDLIIGECVIIPRRIDIEDFYRIEGYLSHKWGLILDQAHPYYNFAPS